MAKPLLQTFPNPQKENDYTIHMDIPEFTCLCPLSKQPDFARLHIAYIPEGACIELKSLKLYLHSYRNRGAFHEAVTNSILKDLCQLIKPRYMQISAHFNVRGGIYTSVVVEHRVEGWQGQLLNKNRTTMFRGES